MRMINSDARKVSWENVSILMRMRYGKENMSKLAHASGVGQATMTRVKEQETSIGMEKLDMIARALEVPTWQLIYPNYDFENDVRPEADPDVPPRSGKDLQYLFDLIPSKSSQREPAYQACFQALVKALQPPQAANPPTDGTSQAGNQKTHTV